MKLKFCTTDGKVVEVETPMALLEAVREQGLSVPWSGDRLGLTEAKLIGDLNPDERYFWIASGLCESMLQEIRSFAEVQPRGNRVPDDLISKVRQLQSWQEALAGMMWASVTGRYSEAYYSPDVDGATIGPGWTFWVKKRQRQVSLDEALALALSLFGDGVHDCANCSHYAECDLSIKKDLHRGASSPAAN